MPKRSSKKPRDVNALAAAIVNEATRDPDEGKDPAAVSLGRRGGLKGGKAFSKKVLNLSAAIALHFVYYNFVRVHQTLKTTPAVASGIADHE